MTVSEHPPARSAWDLFADRTHQQSDHVAIIHESRKVTYGQLYDAAVQISEHLAARHVLHGDIIPVLARRTPEMIACFLGILRSGACYVPIDTESWSEDRVRWTLEETQPRIVVDADGGTLHLAEHAGFQLVSYDEVKAAFIKQDPSGSDRPLTSIRTPFHVQPTDLAYIIFTSGTTSTPKGVMIPHRALLNYVQQGNEDTPFNGDPRPDDTLLLIFSPGFDGMCHMFIGTVHLS